MTVSHISTAGTFRGRAGRFAGLALAGILLSTSAAGQVDVRFQPEVGSSLEKVWTTQHTLIVDEMRRGKGEDEHEVRMPANGIGSEEIIGAVDEYLALGPDRPDRFRRAFHMGKRTSQLMNRDADGQIELRGVKIRQKLDLRGTSIVFTWVEEEGDYGKHFDRREEDESLLPDMRGDMDLWFLLPGRPVEVGDRWTLAPSALIDLFGKGGALEFEEAPGKDDFLVRALDSGVGGRLDQAFGGSVADGEATVELVEVREQEGRRFAVLRLTCDVNYAKDRTDFVRSNTVRLERREGIDYVEAFLTLGVRGAGEVLWDLDRNLPLSLDFRGEEKVFARVKHRAPMDEPGEVRSQSLSLSGNLIVGASFTPRD